MRFLCVVGTRPEAIKLAPVILELARHSEVTTLCSGQHSELAEEPLAWFGIKPDDRIAIGPDSRTLAMLTGALFAPLERMIGKHQPDVIIAQGDTTTVAGDGADGVLSRRSVRPCRGRAAHRQFARRRFPEEFNRVAAGKLATLALLPDATRGRQPARRRRRSGADLHHRQYRHRRAAVGAGAHRQAPAPQAAAGGRILLTAHRRENQGARMEAICRAVSIIVQRIRRRRVRHSGPSEPRGRGHFRALSKDHDRIHLSPPLGYPRTGVGDGAGASDPDRFRRHPGGGAVPAQAGAGAARRDRAAGSGRDGRGASWSAPIPRRWSSAVRRLLTDRTSYAKMAAGGSPYGDGYAAQRIAEAFGLVKGSARAG